jgi:hypothetical protein
LLTACYAFALLGRAYSLAAKFGYTFIWRLNFLRRMPLGSHDQFLAAAASKCHLPET